MSCVYERLSASGCSCNGYVNTSAFCVGWVCVCMCVSACGFVPRHLCVYVHARVWMGEEDFFAEDMKKFSFSLAVFFLPPVDWLSVFFAVSCVCQSLFVRESNITSMSLFIAPRSLDATQIILSLTLCSLEPYLPFPNVRCFYNRYLPDFLPLAPSTKSVFHLNKKYITPQIGFVREKENETDRRRCVYSRARACRWKLFSVKSARRVAGPGFQEMFS